MKNKLLAGPYLVWMILFTLVPLGIVIYYAFTSSVTGEFTLDNLAHMGTYLPIFLRSIGLAAIASLICLVIGYPVAYCIASTGEKWQKLLSMLVMLPMCMSFLLRTLAWVGLLSDQGIINNLLVAFFDFLRSLGGIFSGIPEDFGRLTMIRTPGAVVLGMVYNYLPYMILPLYSTIVKIDHRLIEAAEDLGCNGVQTFNKVVLPLSVPGILSGMTMVFVPAVSTFYISQKLGSSSTVLIGDVIERQFKQGNNPNLGAALSIVLMFLVFVCTGIMNRFGGDEEGSVMV